MAPHFHAAHIEDFNASEGAYYNAGIINRAHYLMMEGEVGTLVEPSRAIGRPKTFHLYYHTITNYVTSSVNFSDFAEATLAACRERMLDTQSTLFFTEDDCLAVRDAWAEVGLMPLGPPIVNCGGEHDYNYIQPAIWAAMHGETVTICPGFYYESLIIAEKDVNLLGWGGFATIVSGSSIHNVLEIYRASSDIASVMFLDGYSVTNRGGGLSISGQIVGGNYIHHVNLYDSLVYGCGGSGIFVENAVLNTNNCIIQGNHAHVGGGLYGYNSQITLFESHVVGNYAIVKGGGIFSRLGSISIEGGSVSDNYLTVLADAGGGIYAHESYIDLQNTIIENNDALTGCGGAVHSRWDTLNSQSVVLESNNTDWGEPPTDNVPNDLCIYYAADHIADPLPGSTFSCFAFPAPICWAL